MQGSHGQVAYARLRGFIEGGELPAGSAIREVELSQRLGMSRTPVREAIAALEAEGLISPDPRQGRVVTRLDYQSVMELYAVRESLEGLGAGLAAGSASEAEILALREMLEEERGLLDDPAALAAHNRRFHQAVYRAGRNRWLARNLDGLQAAMSLLGPTTRTGMARAGSALAEHEAVVRAIAARDPTLATEAMQAHIRATQQARLRTL